MSEVIFSCLATGRAFNSGFVATHNDLRFMPPKSKIRLRCGICGELTNLILPRRASANAQFSATSVRTVKVAHSHANDSLSVTAMHRFRVAIGGIADIARTPQFGRS